VGGILLEIDSAEGANTLAEKIKTTIAGKARVTRPERRTSVLLLNVPTWVEEKEVRGGLINVDVAG